MRRSAFFADGRNLSASGRTSSLLYKVNVQVKQMDKHKVTVEIFGDTYALKGDMEEDRVKRLARMVDRQMRSLTNGARP